MFAILPPLQNAGGLNMPDLLTVRGIVEWHKFCIRIAEGVVPFRPNGDTSPVADAGFLL